MTQYELKVPKFKVPPERMQPSAEWAKGLSHADLARLLMLSIESKSQRGYFVRSEAARRLNLLGAIGPQ